MKFSAPKDVLVKGIQGVQTAINSKSTLPILSNILIDAAGDKVVVTATDLDIAITATLPIKPAIEGSITVPAKKIADIIKEMPDSDEISISVKKNNMVHIECEKNTFKIMGLPKDEFPQIPEFKNKNSITLPQKKLKGMLKMTSFAICNDEARYVLNGVLFVIKPTHIRLVATDGRRLAMIEEKMELPKTLEQKLIIPTKTVGELQKTLAEDGDVTICFGENQVLFDLGATRIISRLIDGDFPNYEQVIPKEAKDKLGVSTGKFLAALKRAALFTNPESMAVKIDIAKDRMVVSKSAPYLGEARVELDADYKGKDITVGFNPDYLMDILKSAAQETMAFEFVDGEKPGVVRLGSDYVYVVLPMQLG